MIYSIRHLKAKSILLKISVFKSLSKIMPSPDIQKFETCLYQPSWQYRVNSFCVIIYILVPNSNIKYNHLLNNIHVGCILKYTHWRGFWPNLRLERQLTPIFPKWPILARFKLFNIRARQYIRQTLKYISLRENALGIQMSKTSHKYLF